ncbi:MAG: 2-C-methyl-D-erythritol 4-phosphate cytidylyltransferase, partial [Candidatus Dormibacteraeota bacterium]|nr:2-C-methyl-D-erythritol 4-phosphate cytidylyltransferase [Candidatus Dormibacteraeota bacterium]
DSVAAALGPCDGHRMVCVHDAARPLAPPELFRAVVGAADRDAAATAAVPCVDTIKRVAEGYVVETIDRSSVMAAQTPQAFHRTVLEDAHAAAARDGVEASDDAVLVERIGVKVAVVQGDPRNIKVTTAGDLDLVRAILEQP